MLRAVTFDFWGTLYQDVDVGNERLGLVSDMLERYGQARPRVELEAGFSHVMSVWDQVWREEQRSLSIERALNEVLGHVGASLPNEAKETLGRSIESVYLETDGPKPVPGVTDVLPGIAQRYRLGLISDTGLTPGRVLREVMRRDGLLSHFEVLTFSDEVGRAKPQPQPFLSTLAGLDASPGEAAHIGDLPETDLRGARNVGMKAVLFLGVSKREDGRSLADAVFSHYSELQQLLEELP